TFYSFLNLFAFFFFFFSSRRRHTRFSRDWSSDVCSSDLSSPCAGPSASGPDGFRAALCPGKHSRLLRREHNGLCPLRRWALDRRSEERRVGKECRSGWWLYG